MSSPLKNYLTNVSLRYLARYSCSSNRFLEYLEKKAKTKLNVTKLPPEAIAVITEIKDQFILKNYINDDRYAQSQARMLFKRGKSLLQIQTTLKQKGVSYKAGLDGLIDEYNTSLNDLELRSAISFAKKNKIGIYRKDNTEEYGYEIKRKHLAKILKAGFSYDIAKKVMGEIDLEMHGDLGEF